MLEVDRHLLRITILLASLLVIIIATLGRNEKKQSDIHRINIVTAGVAAVTEVGPPIDEKTNSF